MQKALLGFLMLALVLGSLVAWLALRSRPDPAGAVDAALAVAPDSQDAPSSDLASEAAKASEPGAPHAGERATAAAAPEDVGGRRTWDPQSSIHVAGEVVLPRGTPIDEELEVLALEGDADPIDRVRDAVLEEAPPAGLLAREPVGEDGSFRVALPPDLQRVWLLARGRYSYTRSAVSADPRSGAPVRLEPRLGAWITGRLVPPQDATAEERELAGLAVQLEPERLTDLRGVGGLGPDAPSDRTTAATEELAFEIRGVQPDAAYTLGAVPEKLAAVKIASFRLEPGEHRAVDLALARGAEVRGRVVDGSGAGIEGADVEMRLDPVLWGQGGTLARETESAADGTFALVAVAAGSSVLNIAREGFLPHSRTLALTDGDVVEGLEIALSSGRTVAGRVVWPDDAPAEGAEVELSFDMSQMGGMAAFNAVSGAEGKAETDASGAFAITGLGDGPFTVRASIGADVEGMLAALGYEAPAASGAGDSAADRGTGAAERTTRASPGETWRARADGVRPGAEEVVLRLEPPIGFAGRVIDELGQPVTRFTLHAQSKVTGLFATFGADTENSTFEDERGEFVFSGLRPGDWQVLAAAEGFGSPGPVDVRLPQPADAEPVTLDLARVARVSGVVVDPDGRPFAGAEVGPQRTAQGMRESAPEERERQRAKSDAQGRFAIEDVTPGDVALVADARDFTESEPVAVEVAPSGSVENVVIKLRVGGRLVGEIYDREGKPDAGKPILAQRPSALGIQRWARSDGEGRFAIEHLVPGSWQVMAMPSQETLQGERGEDDFTSIFAEMRITMVEVKDGQETHVVLGSPPGDPVRVHGEVELDGEGLPDLLVSFVPDGAEEKRPMRYATTDARGRYEVELGGPGDYLITVQKVGGTGSQQSFVLFDTIPEAEEHRLDIAIPLGRISGRVLAHDGSPAANERVTLFIDRARGFGSGFGGNYAEVRTDGEGRYDLTWLDAGRYNVAAGGSFMGGLIGAPSENGRQVRSGISLDAGEWLRDVDFRMEKCGRLEGRVRDVSGGSLSGASIFLHDEESRLIEAFSTTVTDGAGHFEIEALQPGSYSVRARATGRTTAEPAVARVRRGETAEVDLVLDTGTILIVKLTDENGEPLQAAVEVFDEREQEVGGLFSLSEIMEIFMQGNFSSTEQRAGPLAPGRYRVEAKTADGRSATKPVTLSGQPERTLNLRVK